MFNNSCLSKEITDFRTLGTGHKRKKIVIVDQQGCISITRVLHNFSCTKGRIVFENGRSFNLKARTLGGQRVSLFFWTEEWQYQWHRQCEIEKVRPFIETTRPEDLQIFADIVSELSEMERISVDPSFPSLAESKIIEGLWRLSLQQLRNLTALLYLADEEIAA